MMKAVAAHYVMLRPGAEVEYERQRSLVQSVATTLLSRDGRDLEAWLRPSWDLADSEAGRMRVVVDQVASLTDASLEAWHAHLLGASKAKDWVPREE